MPAWPLYTNLGGIEMWLNYHIDPHEQILVQYLKTTVNYQGVFYQVDNPRLTSHNKQTDDRFRLLYNGHISEGSIFEFCKEYNFYENTKHH